MRKILILITILFFAASLAAQSTHTTRVEPLRNEKWWGLYVGGDVQQPFLVDFEAGASECSDEYFTTSMIISSEGRYIWSAYPMEVSMKGNVITIHSQAEEVSVKKGGRDLRDAYLVCRHKNMPPDGAPIPRELFTDPVYDLGMSPGTLNNQESILQYATGLIGSGHSAGIILLPDGWQSLARGCDFNRDLYPDAVGMIRELHKMGFRLMLTATPYVRAAGLNYSAARLAGKLLGGTDGQPLVFETQAGYSACLDITSDEVLATMQEGFKALKDKYGVDGFLFDCLALLGHIGHDKDLTLAFMESWNGLGEEMGIVARSPAMGMNPADSVNWMGREEALSWNSMTAAVSRTITAGLSGYIYSHFRPGGFYGAEIDENLLLRAIQLSLFMPVTALPISFDAIRNPVYVAELEKAVELHVSLKDYFADLLDEAADTVEPLVRHMEYQFPGQGFANCNDQFMLGARYLVAPVLDPSPRRTVRLPRGMWTAADGTKHRGPRVITVDVSDGKMAFFTLQGK